MYSLILNTLLLTTAISVVIRPSPRRIIIINRNKANELSINWISKIKNYELPLYTLFPFYNFASALNERKNNYNNSNLDLLLACEQEFYNNDNVVKPSIASIYASHLCIASVNKVNKSISISKILSNPDIMYKEENHLVNTSINLRESLTDFAEYKHFELDFTQLQVWDNGRYFLMMNEDIFF